MNLDKAINPIHTPCKDCVFAKYENNTQIDCFVNYLDTYRSKNIEILEAYDDQKEFYIINSKKCIGYRENKWFKQFDLQDSDIDQKIKKYHETNVLDYMIVIDLKNLVIDQLENILLQISTISIQPKKVVFIRYADNNLAFPYSSIENLLKKYNAKYKWRIQTILDPLLSYDQIINNITNLNTSYRFILCVNKYNNDLDRIISLTNQKVHHDLDQFDIIANEDHSCLIYSGVIFRFETFHGKDFLNDKDHYLIV